MHSRRFQEFPGVLATLKPLLHRCELPWILWPGEEDPFNYCKVIYKTCNKFYFLFYFFGLDYNKFWTLINFCVWNFLRLMYSKKFTTRIDFFGETGQFFYIMIRQYVRSRKMKISEFDPDFLSQNAQNVHANYRISFGFEN